jgi:outer membrane protein assembly factor BamB
LSCLTADYLVISGIDGLLTLQTPTGKAVWQKNRSHDSVTCSESLVFSSNFPSASISAFDLSTGQEIWKTTQPQRGFYGVIYNFETGKLIGEEYSQSGDFYVIEPQSGLLEDSFLNTSYAPTGGTWDHGPMYLIDRGELFLGGTVQDAGTGQLIYQADLYDSFVPPVVTTDTIYLSDSSAAGVVALDRTTFALKWIHSPERRVQNKPVRPISPIAILEGVGYAVFSDATLSAFDLETGQELGYWQPGWLDLSRWPACRLISFPGCTRMARAGVTTSDDTLFVSFGDGKLYAFGE